MLSPRVSLNTLPLSFEVNRGQTDGRVRFLSHGGGYTLFLTTTDAVLASRTSSSAVIASPGRIVRPRPTQETVVHLRPIGANPGPELVGLHELPGKVNYLIGHDPRGWHTDIPTYSRIAYRNVYPGIDLIYFGAQGRLKCDWVLRPGAHPAAIKIRADGEGHLGLDGQGDLVLPARNGTLVQNKPLVYQEVGHKRHIIPGRYVLTGPREVTFKIGLYDAALPLTIDPVLTYSTYLGGAGDDEGNSIAVDSAGNAYVTGSTESSNFPIASPLRGSLSSSPDAFVAKLNTAGTALIYSTYLGGTASDRGNGIAVDGQGSAYVTGVTNSSDFPSVNGLSTPKDCLPSPYKRCTEFKGFLAKLSPSGTSLVFSTYLGGNCCDDFGFGITTDNGGNSYVTGLAFSDDFPITPGAFQAIHRGFTDAFVAKFGSGGNLIYSTYLGGDSFDGGSGIAVDGSGNAFVAGYTDSTNFPTASPSQAGLGGNCPGSDIPCSDAFVAKLNPTGSALIYSTYLGGQDTDAASGIALDSAGNAYVTGSTRSGNFPTLNPLFGVNGGGTCQDRGHPAPCTDAFVAKVSAAGALIYSTYLGGAGDDRGNGIAVDRSGDAFVVGDTAATNFPLTNALQSVPGGGSCADDSGNAAPCTDAFVAELSPVGSSLIYSTYLGGPGNDSGRGIALDGAGNAYITGTTSSTSFRVQTALQSSRGGGSDAFVAKIGEPPATPTLVPPTATPTATPTTTPTATPLAPTLTPPETPRSLHVAVSGTLRAKYSGTLRVTVSDSPSSARHRLRTYTPVEGATVRLDGRSVGMKKVLKKKTGRRGMVTFKNLHPSRGGAVILKISKSGFPSVTRRINVRR